MHRIIPYAMIKFSISWQRSGFDISFMKLIKNHMHQNHENIWQNDDEIYVVHVPMISTKSSKNHQTLHDIMSDIN